ncbi:MAG: NAD(P)-dependent oxidoreductase, partial [Actinomycetes bacterium]
QWKRSKYSGVEVNEKIVGIVGFGRIGQLVAQRLAGFGVEMIAFDPYVLPARAAQLGVRMVDLDELLETSDFITVHLPKNKDTLGLIGAPELAKVKPSVRIINAARGGIVDEQALYDAIVAGQVAGAGLDVYSKEPCTDSPLFTLDKVVATPHLGASTDEAQEKAGVSVAKSVRLALAGELVPDAVNVQSGELDEEVRPYVGATERLGRIASTLAKAPIAQVQLEMLGDLAGHDGRVLELSALKGIFSVVSDDPVSYVNAPVLAADRGVAVATISEGESLEHRCLVRIRLALSDGSRVSVAATVIAPRQDEKLVEIDGFEIDVPISDHMAFFRYSDRPGVVGATGNILGAAKVNIAGMQVSRTKPGGQALIALTVDSRIPPATLAQIATEIGADSVTAVDLD